MHKMLRLVICDLHKGQPNDSPFSYEYILLAVNMFICLVGKASFVRLSIYEQATLHAICMWQDRTRGGGEETNHCAGRRLRYSTTHGYADANTTARLAAGHAAVALVPIADAAAGQRSAFGE